MTRYDAVVLDNDGVLLEPPEYGAVREAIREAFRAHGVPDPPAEHVETMLGTDAGAIRAVCEGHDIDPDTFWRKREANSSRAQRARMREGHTSTYGDVSTLSALDLPLGIVSNNQQRTIEHAVEFFGIDAVEVAYGREPTIEGIRRAKPNPHYLERALSDLGAEDALYVGDSNVDIAAADALGIDSAFLRRDHRRDYDLAREPTHEIGGLAELPALLE